MSEHSINSTGHDDNGRYYNLGDDAPYDGITVDEADGTVTFHGRPDSEAVLRDLLAIQRDFMLGYGTDELHRNPKNALQEAVELLEGRGHDREELVAPMNQPVFGLDE